MNIDPIRRPSRTTGMRRLPKYVVVRCLVLCLGGPTALLAGCVPPGVAPAGAPPPSEGGDPEVGEPGSGEDSGPAAGVASVRGARLFGEEELVDLLIEDGRVEAVVPAGAAPAGDQAVEADGRVVVPAFIDSHVHLVYLPEAEAMADGGIAAAVDLAAPMEFFGRDFGDVRVVGSGPMVTAVSGYPTRSWGSRGYGVECGNAEEAEAAVEMLAEAGAVVVKLPVTGEPVLSEHALRAAADRAHALGLKVASHALGSAEALRAAAIGADVLAHTPVQPLSDEAVDAWAGRAVISTLRAFGGSEAAIDNLRRLRDAGTVVLYGTDFGNTRTPGIDPNELALMAAAGMDDAAILESATSAPARWWGIDRLGSLSAGSDASFLLISPDAEGDPAAFGSADAVVLRGILR